MQSGIRAVKTAARQKHMPLNSYVSLSKPVYEDESERTLVDMLVEREAVDPEDVEMLQDMIVAAVNEALRAAESDSASTMQQLTGGLGLPF